MPEELYLFLDFDDTLSDFGVLGPQYIAATSRLLAEQFGGEAASWADAVQRQVVDSKRRYEETFVDRPLAGYCTWIGAERARAAESVFASVGISLSSDVNPGELALRVQSEALKRCNASFAGTLEAMRALKASGVRLQMASSQEAEYLRAALRGAGLEGFFDRCFGPDLVDCAKEGPEFYRRIFSACGISSSQTVVVDDQAMCLDWAEETGARVVQACMKPEADPEFPVIVRSMGELVEAVGEGRQWTS